MTPNLSSTGFKLLQERMAANQTWGPPESYGELVESKLQVACEHWLREQGIWYSHDRSRKGERPGIPDLIMCIAGRFVACELKSKKGKLRPEQMTEMAVIRKSGGRVFVARNLDEFIMGCEEKI